MVEVIEGTGLWLARRWGEYFAMVATSVGLPLEIYDLTRKVTATTLIFFAINLALVLYLVLTKRLFGARGGKAAYEARLRSESIMEARPRRPPRGEGSRRSDAAGGVAAGGAAEVAGGGGAAGDPLAAGPLELAVPTRPKTLGTRRTRCGAR